MIRALTLSKVNRPFMDRLPTRAQDTILRYVARRHQASVDSHLRPAATLVTQNAARLDDQVLSDLRAALNHEDWNRRLLNATGDGQADVTEWIAANPRPPRSMRLARPS
jgi:hypothetical protein